MIFQDKTMFISRGVPGSGKSFATRRVGNFVITQLQLPAELPIFCTFSTDDFWMDENGYNFNPSRLGEAHNWNQKRVEQACMKQVPFVAVDNTNTTYKEMKAYIYLAKFWNYEVCMVYPTTEWANDAVECAKRNEHGVPLETIQKMLDRFQNHATIELNAGRRFNKLLV